jgi:3-oxoacyl-[acyl-carrier-protein] synthase-3
VTGNALPLAGVELGVAGDKCDLLRVEGDGLSGLRLRMDGPRLATAAVETLAELVCEVSQRHQLSLKDLSAVIVHGGNGRLPGLVARRLGLPEERVWSETASRGNLGSASLPVAWAARSTPLTGPVAWAAVGAGLVLGAALTLPPAPVP